jgi:hypothetical protein
MVLSSATAAVRDALGATGDVAAAFASAGYLVGFPLAVAVDLLGGAVPESVVPAAAVLAGVAGAYVFVAGRPPLALLTDFALAAFLALVAFGALAFVVVATLGGVETGSTVHAATLLASVVVSYGAGTVYVTARRRRHESATRGEESSA